MNLKKKKGYNNYKKANLLRVINKIQNRSEN